MLEALEYKKLKLILTSLNEENGVNPLTAWCLPKGHTYLDKPPGLSAGLF